MESSESMKERTTRPSNRIPVLWSDTVFEPVILVGAIRTPARDLNALYQELAALNAALQQRFNNIKPI